MLSTNVDGTLANAAPLELDELWPAPAPGTQLLVATVEATLEGETLPTAGPACVHGASAASCLTLWDAKTPLLVGNVGAESAAYKNFTLFSAAPVINNGWALVGDMSKIVPCSPQRFVAPSDHGAPRATDLSIKSNGEGDAGKGGLTFTVLGSPLENVAVTVVAPSAQGTAGALDGTIIVTTVVVGASGSSKVVCANATCKQV